MVVGLGPNGKSLPRLELTMRMRSVAALMLVLSCMSLLAEQLVKVEKPTASAPALSDPAPRVAAATGPAEGMARNLIRNGDFEANQPGNMLPVINASQSRATTDTLLNLALLHDTPLWSEF